MPKLWNTGTKRMLTMIAMGLVGWFVLAMSVEQVPSVPEMLTNPLLMGFSILTVAAAYLLFSI